MFYTATLINAKGYKRNVEVQAESAHTAQQLAERCYHSERVVRLAFTPQTTR